MKAVVFTKYGAPDVLELKDVEKPTPNDDEVLIRVHAVSINDWDFEAMRGRPFINRMMFGLRKPKKRILGSDIAGRIEAAGRNVTKFRVGDEVFGDLSGRWGGFAEYVCAREKQLARKSPRMTFEQAAAIPQAAMLAVQALRDVARLQAGQSLLINGAGGGVGTFAIQLAKHYGAEITAVDHTEKLEVMRNLGADHLIDYTSEDCTQSGRRYDVILDVKTQRPVRDFKRVLTADGIYVTCGGSMGRLAEALLTAPRMLHVVMLKTNKDLELMKELFDAGRVVPVIDGPYTLRAIPDAMRHFATGRHKGKVVIAI